MRKLTLATALLLVLIGALPAAAKITDTGKILDSSPEFLNGRFTFSGVEQLVRRIQDRSTLPPYGVADCYQILNTDFQLIKTIFIPESEGPSEVVDMTCFSAETDYMPDVIMSQTLFNNDELYEWVIPIVKEHFIIGYKVISENWQTLTEINFPKGYISDYCGLNLYCMSDGDVYLLAKVREEVDSTYQPWSLVYRIDKENGSVSQIGEPLKIGVSPTAPRRGTPVTVDLSAEKGECMVEVVAADGRVVARKMNCSGRTTIETSGLASGLYVVNVVNGQNRREATKIVVR